MMCRLSNDRTDIYDLGVILLETIVGRKMISKNDIKVSKEIVSSLPSWIVIDGHQKYLSRT